MVFTAESVRAIMAGRKTQTRRVVTPQPWSISPEGLIWRHGPSDPPVRMGDYCTRHVSCRPLDRIWVREAFVVESNHGLGDSTEYPPPHNDGRPIRWHEDGDNGRWWQQAHYAATDPNPGLSCEHERCEGDPCGRWGSPLHMPRWASRITLAVEAVWAQRIQDITDADADAEGRGLIWGGGCMYRTFDTAWDALNAKRGYAWHLNPLVIAYKFSVLTPNG